MIQIAAKTFLTALQAVSGVVEKRQTLPILSHVLIVCKDNQLTVTGTDLEIEIIYQLQLESAVDNFAITVPARKMLEICRALSEKTQMNLNLQNTQRLEIQTPQGQFVVNSYLTEEFPKVRLPEQGRSLNINSRRLIELFEKSYFAVAQEDTRYYLTGLFFEAEGHTLTVVATDGHRLARAVYEREECIEQKIQAIVPRKAVSEIIKLLNLIDAPVALMLDDHHLWFKVDKIQLVTKLIESQYPNYSQVIPRQNGLTISVSRDELKQSLQRVVIFSNDENHGVEFILSHQQLRIFTHNPEQEQAEEILIVDYEGDPFEIVLSARYLLDVLEALPPGKIDMQLVDAFTGVRITSETAPHLLYVIMPMQP